MDPAEGTGKRPEASKSTVEYNLTYMKGSESMVVSGASNILIISYSYVVELATGERDETTAGARVVESIPCRRLSKWPRAEATELSLCLQRSADVNRGIVAK